MRSVFRSKREKRSILPAGSRSTAEFGLIGEVGHIRKTNISPNRRISLADMHAEDAEIADATHANVVNYFVENHHRSDIRRRDYRSG
jgi:hypothetical protein